MDESKIIKRTIFCHFSFRSPKGADYGIFSAAFYKEYEGINLLMKSVRKYKLWKDHQHIKAVQALEHALRFIYENQGKMLETSTKKTVSVEVYLVTDNNILAAWILNPNKSKYKEYVERAVANYRTNAPKEIIVTVGLAKVRKYEKSNKFCVEKYVENNAEYWEQRKGGSIKIKIDGEVKSVLDYCDNKESKTEIISGGVD